METAWLANSERRRSERWQSDRPISWHISRIRGVRSGRLSQRSLHSLVVDVGNDQLCSVGTHMTPSDDLQAFVHGFRDAVVRRIEAGYEGMSRMYVEILA